jgi:subtilase family serine protease
MSSLRRFGARRLVLIGAAVVLGSGMASAGLLSAAPAGADPGGVPNPAASGQARGHVVVCGPADPNSARCHSDLLTTNGRVVSSASAPVPGSLGPADLQSAYKLPSATAGSGQTVAIVDAYNDPYAESDMGVYRSHYGIPSCTSANGCFRKVNQNGSTSYPRNNGSWSQEIALDLDMVSAACPGCHILLVEASSPTYGNLGTAVNTAVRLGATEVSNSYGGSEFGSETSYDTYYNHPGVAITASSGDNGYGVQYPAASPYVTGVGGTTLSRATNARGWSETAWSGAGSGCSSYQPKPSWQSNCGSGHRTVADVSAVADPNTGVAVYDSYAYQGYSGWLVFGGTSVASPIIASTYALAGNAASAVSGSYSYSHASSLNDITSGTNSSSGCSPAYLCSAGPGYDGPTGNGTPAGTGAF